MDDKMSLVTSLPRKRKLHEAISVSDFDYTDSTKKGQSKKQNHSEIEKRRRDKMNTYIMELASIIPVCNNMSQKLDKLTVLRMAVQHMKLLKGSANYPSETYYKPSFLTNDEVKHLILQSAEGFLFVVSCDRGCILFVSESVSQVLNYSQRDLLGQSWFDILHSKDIAKVKEQLSSADLSPKERLIDSRTMLPVKNGIQPIEVQLCPGSRRSFYCRMKHKCPMSVKVLSGNGAPKKHKSQAFDRRYCKIYCTGYLKSWAPANLRLEEDIESGSCKLSCLVAVGRVVTPDVCSQSSDGGDINLRTMQFTSRHSMDGKFVFVDQRVTVVINYLPQELLGTFFHEYLNQNDANHILECFRLALETKEPVDSQTYQFRSKNGSYLSLNSTWKCFHNPWTKELEYVVAKHTLHSDDVERDSLSQQVQDTNSSSLDTVVSYSSTLGGTTGDSFNKFTRSEIAGKVGLKSEENRPKSQRPMSIPSAPLSTKVTDTLARHVCPPPPLPPETCDSLPHFQDLSIDAGTQRDFGLEGNKVSMNPSSSFQFVSGLSHSEPNADVELIDTLMGNEMLQASLHNNSNSEGNDEAAMAVIMSLLEADAGLGGPVDFSGLPWPLP